jgi:hypothetical protein
MRNEIVFKNDSTFTGKGTFKDEYAVLDKEQAKAWFPKAVTEFNEIFENYQIALSDDGKITGDERISLINELDDFLNILISLYDYIGNIPEKIYDIDLMAFNFRIKINIIKNIWIANGYYPDTFLKATEDFKAFFAGKLAPEFKLLVSLFKTYPFCNEAEIPHHEKEKVKLAISRLIHLIFKIRFQIEKCIINE